MAIKIYTGKTSKKPIIIDLVKVVAKPIKKAIAKLHPNNVVILFIIIFTPKLIIQTQTGLEYSAG